MLIKKRGVVVLLIQIKDLIDQGYTLKKIASILNKDYEEIKKIMKDLKYSNSTEEREEYERLKKQLNVNRNNSLKEAGRKNKNNLPKVMGFKGNIIDLLKTEKIDVGKGAELLNVSLNAMLNLIREENHRTPNPVLQNIIEEYKEKDLFLNKGYASKSSELHTEKSIMDTSINGLKTKPCLNEEEIKRVIDYRIKYSLNLNFICHTFPISHQTIEKYEERLILNDEMGYYQEKLAFLHHKYATIARSFYNGAPRK